jgi:3-phosphoshikimate 1-carboxyvinyltransferase
MTTELKKINAQLLNKGNDNLQLIPDFKIGDGAFETYEDHRMAMAFAPLALKHKIKINNPNVVSKSYPSFWDDLKRAGLVVD